MHAAVALVTNGLTIEHCYWSLNTKKYTLRQLQNRKIIPSGSRFLHGTLSTLAPRFE